MELVTPAPVPESSRTVRRVRRWAVASSLVTPVALIGGWTVAAARQPEQYDSIRHTISVLAGHGGHDRAIMTTALVLAGLCHVVTAAGLSGARPAGRMLLALGGLGTVVVAALPLPAHGPSVAHGFAALIALTALAVWPVVAGRRPAAVIATVGLVGLVVLCGLQLLGGGAYIGLTERLLVGAEAVWPAVVTLNARHSRTDQPPMAY